MGKLSEDMWKLQLLIMKRDSNLTRENISECLKLSLTVKNILLWYELHYIAWNRTHRTMRHIQFYIDHPSLDVRKQRACCGQAGSKQKIFCYRISHILYRRDSSPFMSPEPLLFVLTETTRLFDCTLLWIINL